MASYSENTKTREVFLSNLAIIFPKLSILSNNLFSSSSLSSLLGSSMSRLPSPKMIISPTLLITVRQKGHLLFSDNVIIRHSKQKEFLQQGVID